MVCDAWFTIMGTIYRLLVVNTHIYNIEQRRFNYLQCYRMLARPAVTFVL